MDIGGGNGPTWVHWHSHPHVIMINTHLVILL
jgi:hypothetical protein